MAVRARTAMEEGDPIHGYLPSGSVAAVIEDLPTCAELIQQIMREAEETVKRLAN